MTGCQGNVKGVAEILRVLSLLLVLACILNALAVNASDNYEGACTVVWEGSKSYAFIPENDTVKPYELDRFSEASQPNKLVSLRKRNWRDHLDDLLVRAHYDGTWCYLHSGKMLIRDKFKRSSLYRAIALKAKAAEHFVEPLYKNSSLSTDIKPVEELLSRLELRPSKNRYERESVVEVWSRVQTKSSSRWHRFLNFWRNLFDYSPDEGYTRAVLNFFKNSVTLQTSLDKVSRIHLYSVKVDSANVILLQHYDLLTGLKFPFPERVRSFKYPGKSKAKNIPNELTISGGNGTHIITKLRGYTKTKGTWQLRHQQKSTVDNFIVRAESEGPFFAQFFLDDMNGNSVVKVRRHKLRNLIYGRKNWLTFLRYGTHKYDLSFPDSVDEYTLEKLAPEVIIMTFLFDYYHIYKI